MIELAKKYAVVKDLLLEKNIRAPAIIRAVIYVICCIVMFYQVSSSCLEYYQYKTVVQIRITNQEKQNMPAISVCRQMKATEYLELLKNSDPEFEAKFANKAMSTTAEMKTDLNTTEEKEEEKQWDALANISHYFDLTDPPRTPKTFFDIVKPSLQVTCYDVRTSEPKPCEAVSDVINSFSQRRICVTYFSNLYINYNFSDDKFNISDNVTEKEENKESVFAYLSVCYYLYSSKYKNYFDNFLFNDIISFGLTI